MTRRPVELPAVAARALDGRPAPGGRGVLTVILLLTLGWTAFQVDWGDAVPRTGGLGVLRSLLGGIVRPDLSSETLSRAVEATWLTIVYAVAGLTLALALGLPLGVMASGAIAPPRVRRASMVVGRGVLAAMRAVHELVWAWLFVVAVGLSPAAAVLAIGIPYGGILGRIYADLLNDLPEAPLRALRVAGAGRIEALAYGRVPMTLPDLVAYTFYRFECALRASAIMGFVGLGGLGFEIQIALADLDYRQVGTYLAALVLLIAAVEAWSALVRNEVAR
ncbi:MAG: ABC transporter permease subunit [Dehalococcoidia bacterium]